MHGSNSSNGAGAPRSPLVDRQTPATVVPAQTPSSTPEHKLNGWTSKLASLDAPSLEKVTGFLHQVAHGLPTTAAQADRAFNLLVQKEEFDVFVDVFKTYSAVLEAGRGDGARSEPLRRAFVLDVAPDWAPTPAAEAHLIHALKSAGVNHLIVQPDEDGHTIPASVFHFIGLLQGTDITSLGIHGPVALSDQAAHAFSSARLESIEWSPIGQPATGLNALAIALMACRSLKHLTLNMSNAQIAAITPALAQLQDGPALESVRLANEKMEDMTDAMCIKAFMKQVGQYGSLKKLSWKMPELAITGLELAVLRPLKGHKSLTHLSITADRHTHPTSSTVFALPTIISFAATCKSLTHVELVVDDPGVEAAPTLRDYAEFFINNPDLLADCQTMADLLERPGLALQWLKVGGMLVAPDVARALFRALAMNKSLTDLDLETCLFDLPSTQDLTKSLETNDVLVNIRMPRALRQYCLTIADGSIYGLQNNPAAPGLALEPHQANPPASLATATAALAETQTHAEAFLEASKTMFRGSRRAVFGPQAYLESSINIRQFMAAAYQANVPLAGNTGPQLWALPALAMAQALGDHQHLATTVRLSGVSKDPGASPPGTAEEAGPEPHPHLKKRLMAEKDTHETLSQAAKAGDASKVEAELRAGAIDYGGRVESASTNESVKAVFRKNAPPTDRFTTPTTTTTSGQTTTSTTATVGTTAARTTTSSTATATEPTTGGPPADVGDMPPGAAPSLPD